ncbi:MAG TPA: 2,3-diphosphoglycerate-dependent phosphoglycerate mutase [Candidatus Limnocylindrales bacterium]|nr:2,3-diphosphoglycerate-dependent phosphoglycerate mutase [Candidatus Limnocylindrales bacterium]
MATLALVRHGQSQWNLENRFTGWVDVPLTDLGRQEARRAGELLAETGVHFDIAFTSSLVRAQDTLAIMLEVLGQTGLATERDDALNERHYGSLQGLNKAETAEKYGAEQVHIWRRSYDVPPPDGESLADTAARTLPYFESRIMPELRAGKNVLVAAHGNSLRSIVMRLDDLTREQVLELNLDTGVPLLYDFDEQGRIRSKRVLRP